MAMILVCAAALVGIATGDALHPRPGPLIGVGLLAGLGACVAWSLPGWRSVAVLVCALCLGAARPAFPALQVELPSVFADSRAAARAGITAWLPEPQASLLAGVLLGGFGQLSPAFRLELQRSGLSHFVAIDGFKLVVATASFGWLATRLVGIRTALIGSLVAVTAYALFTGAHPSAVRAALMAGLSSVAALSGRLHDPLTSLSVAAAGMAIVDPGIVFDLGFQLSVSATLGILLLWPPLRRWLSLGRLPRFVQEPLGLTLAITLACLPVTLGTFKLVSLVSPLAHVMAVPLLAPALIAAAVLAAVSSVPVLAWVVAWAAWVPASALVAVTHAFGSAPGAAVSVSPPPVLVSLLTASLLLALGLWHLPELYQVRRRWTRLWLRLYCALT